MSVCAFVCVCISVSVCAVVCVCVCVCVCMCVLCKLVTRIEMQSVEYNTCACDNVCK